MNWVGHDLKVGINGTKSISAISRSEIRKMMYLLKSLFGLWLSPRIQESKIQCIHQQIFLMTQVRGNYKKTFSSFKRKVNHKHM